MKSIEIIGGGLAGLGLGTTLRTAGIPTTIHEAGNYPRHRVCGEFISGLDTKTIQHLDLQPILQGSTLNRTAVWMRRNREIYRHNLPAPAYGLSRHELDRRLAQRFISLGGELVTGSRVPPTENLEGRIWATGRHRSKSDWIGLKLHCHNYRPQADLEFHLGDQAYLGISRIENGRCNCCGLFRRRAEIRASAEDVFFAYLEAAGLERIAGQIQAADVDLDSRAAVAGINFSWRERRTGQVSLGDAFGMIPPFTGDGMAIAFQSAAAATPTLIAFARNEISWSEACVRIQSSIRSRFNRRLTLANAIHPLLLNPAAQACLTAITRARLLPFRYLFHCLH